MREDSPSIYYSVEIHSSAKSFLELREDQVRSFLRGNGHPAVIWKLQRYDYSDDIFELCDYREQARILAEFSKSQLNCDNEFESAIAKWEHEQHPQREKFYLIQINSKIRGPQLPSQEEVKALLDEVRFETVIDYPDSEQRVGISVSAFDEERIARRFQEVFDNTDYTFSIKAINAGIPPFRDRKRFIQINLDILRE